MFWIITSTIIAAAIALTMIIVRIKASEKPTSKSRIILPPLMMSTGALMFLFPVFQVGWMEAFEAIGVGIVFSLFLIRSSKLEIKNKAIYLVPSKAFVFILFGLLIVRIIGKLIVGSKISVAETGGLFYLVGFGMIFTWRLAILYKYHQLEKNIIYQKEP